MIVEELRKHSAYTRLLESVSDSNTKEKYLPIFEVSGVTSSLYDDLIKLVSEDTKKGVISVTRDNIELRKYLDSAILVILKEAKATELIKTVIEYGYSRTEKIESVGEYSVKGDVLNFWPPGFNHPVRVSFFDEEVESATQYDEIYGKSYKEVNFFLLGDLKKIELQSQLEQIWILNPHLQALNAIMIFGGDTLDTYSSRSHIEFDFEYPPLYYNRLDILEKELDEKFNQGYKIKLYSKNKDLLSEKLKKQLVTGENLDSGFQSKELKLIVLSDKELFGTVFLSAEAKKLSSERARKILANLEGEIEVGDYIVHEEHGVGVYGGIKQEKYTQEILVGVGDRITKTFKEDYILIQYAEGDELFVPLTQIDKLTKYISIDEQDPEITRLGKTDWETIRRKAKESIFAMAKELVSLYAKRELAKTTSIDTNTTSGYQDFIDKFEYKVTPDQEQTEKDILKDLEKDRPMNRIIVGDVGFGKTEVAMRTAYKIVENGYQVVVLCPTTVLATQHEKVFRDRFSPFGIKTGTLSRSNSSGEKEVLEGIRNGEISIAIGTHRLLSKDVRFKKLGLVIIDEEQKFGVKQKEKLKELELGVHVLSMSATPIPRSLSMALSSIQDISIIQTPPQGRKAIETIVSKMDHEKVKSAIEFELERKGQVYYLHNDVKTIQSAASKLEKMLRKTKIIFAHGQMPPQQLRTNVEDFYEGKYDILVCTTIIENGIDMPNVNTIIVEHAQNFGLGQMYQLRGRVGRSDKQAYAYFFYDGDDLEKDDSILEANIKDVATLKKFRERRKYRMRLKAIKETSELGSGFRLASRDLEIRGAGNLLGKQQHGNIKQIGYALYMQMLAEEIEKLKNYVE